jgi:hypothetical protein
VGTPDQARLAACVCALPRQLIGARDAWPLARALVAMPIGDALTGEAAAAWRVVTAAMRSPAADEPRAWAVAHG